MRSTPRALAVTTVVLLYTIMLGATYNGILTPMFKTFNVVLIGGGLIGWWIARRRWNWYRSPLDGAILLWIAAFALSLLANLDSWRRIALGLWYMGLYIILWYALFDALANRTLRRDTLIDGLLIVGALIVGIGWFQFINALEAGFVRPVSTFGNSNALAAFLVLIIPFIFERIGSRNPITRLSLTLYGLTTILLLLLTFSRGALIALAAIVAARIALFAYEHHLHQVKARRVYLATLSQNTKIALVVSGLTLIIAGVGITLFLIATLSIGGRTLEFRTFLYDTAIRLTVEQPITGTGLFTFGGGLSRLYSIPPREPHAHAHNLFLGVSAELGIIGLIALFLTMWFIMRAARRNLNALEAREKRPLRAGIIALIAFGVHQLLDLPAITPAIFIVLLVILAVTITPPDPFRWRGITIRAALAVGAVALLTTGVFGAATYQAYINIMSGVNEGNAGERAVALDAVIMLDPSMPVYHQQQGYLYAVAENYLSAVTSFTRYTQLAPEYVSGWANLAAVYDALDDQTNALLMIERARAAAPELTELAFAQTRYQSDQPVPMRWRTLDPFAADYALNENINSIQFLRLAIRRQLLPVLFLAPE